MCVQTCMHKCMSMSAVNVRVTGMWYACGACAVTCFMRHALVPTFVTCGKETLVKRLHRSNALSPMSTAAGKEMTVTPARLKALVPSSVTLGNSAVTGLDGDTLSKAPAAYARTARTC